MVLQSHSQLVAVYFQEFVPDICFNKGPNKVLLIQSGVGQDIQIYFCINRPCRSVYLKWHHKDSRKDDSGR